MKYWLKTDEDDWIVLLGSVDLVVFNYDDFACDVIDFKTASRFTLPTGKYDKNPTYFSQLYNYTYFLENEILHPQLSFPEIKLVYINKHNLATYEVVEKYDMEKSKKLWDNLIERTELFHTCVVNKVLPDAEPMRWCKYCNWKTFCDKDECPK